MEALRRAPIDRRARVMAAHREPCSGASGVLRSRAGAVAYKGGTGHGHSWQSHARSGDTVGFGSVRRFAALSVATLLGSVAFGSAAGSAGEPANAVRICGERDVLLEQFAMQHREKPQALGLGADGGVIEVLVSPEGGRTMLVTYPDRPTCVVAMGEAWEMLQLAGDPA
jgi:hypothetical protein